MSLSHGILGLLTYQDGTGYDLAKMFEGSLNYFWHAQNSQIYRELSQMKKQGWVTSRSIIQDGRPNKKMYSITDAGRKELDTWLADARPEFENPHQSILMRVFFGANAPEATLTLLKECRDQCKRAIETNRPNASRNADAYAAIAENGDQKRKYWLMAMNYGTAQKKTMMEWAERCIEQIEKEMTE